MARKSPNVLIVTGDEAFLRRRFVREIISDKVSEGWRVVDHADAAVSDQLETALTPSSMFVQAKSQTLVVVENPHKADPKIFEEHLKGADADTVLLLHYAGIPKGNTKFGKFVATQKSNTKEWKAPKPWEAQKLAAAFIVRELKEEGLGIDPDTAMAMVARAGADLGILSFECLKLVMLAQAEGVTDIKPDHVKQTLAPLLEAEIQPVIDAVAARSVKRLSRSLQRVKETRKGDATIPVCRVLGGTVTKWIGIADLKEKGKDPNGMATMLDLNPYHLKKNLLPQVNRWKRGELVGLLRVLAVSERAVLSGAINPWAGLVGRLISVCRAQ